MEQDAIRKRELQDRVVVLDLEPAFRRHAVRIYVECGLKRASGIKPAFKGLLRHLSSIPA
jgi:hypothetical protein